MIIKTAHICSEKENFLRIELAFCFLFVISYYIILEKVKTIMEGVREIMMQKVSTKIDVQRGEYTNGSHILLIWEAYQH